MYTPLVGVEISQMPRIILGGNGFNETADSTLIDRDARLTDISFNAGRIAIHVEMFNTTREAPRGLQCAVLATVGLRNQEIAELLGVSENTVKTHMSHVLSLMGTSHRPGLAQKMIDNGILEIITPGEELNLKPPQRTILRSLSRGESTETIAKDKGTNRGAIKRQLDAIYQNNGLSSQEQAVMAGVLSGSLFSTTNYREEDGKYGHLARLIHALSPDKESDHPFTSEICLREELPRITLRGTFIESPDGDTQIDGTTEFTSLGLNTGRIAIHEEAFATGKHPAHQMFRVVVLATLGLNNSEIAALLKINSTTVNVHLNRAFKSMSTTRYGLAQRMVDSGAYEIVNTGERLHLTEIQRGHLPGLYHGEPTKAIAEGKAKTIKAQSLQKTLNSILKNNGLRNREQLVLAALLGSEDLSIRNKLISGGEVITYAQHPWHSLSDRPRIVVYRRYAMPSEGLEIKGVTDLAVIDFNGGKIAIHGHKNGELAFSKQCQILASIGLSNEDIGVLLMREPKYIRHVLQANTRTEDGIARQLFTNGILRIVKPGRLLNLTLEETQLLKLMSDDTTRQALKEFGYSPVRIWGYLSKVHERTGLNKRQMVFAGLISGELLSTYRTKPTLRGESNS